MQLRFPYDEVRAIMRPRTVAERNVRNVLIDGIGVGVSAGISTFLPVFLARLGASSLLVGLITSLPALAGALFAVAIGRFLERQRNIVPWYSGMRVWVLWSYAIFGLLPFVVPLAAVPWLVIAIWALVTIPATFVNVAFTVVMGGVAGPKGRFFLMSLRWSSLGAVTAVTVAIVGQILDRIAFPLNYQVVFLCSFVSGLLSFLFSRAIVLPDRAAGGRGTGGQGDGGTGGRGDGGTGEVERQGGAPARFALFAPLRILQGPDALLRAPDALMATVRAAPPAFVRLATAGFVFRAGVAMALPLFPLYWVREVGASDAWIGIITTANSAVLLVAYIFWSAITRRIGNSGTLIASGFGMALYPLLTASTHAVWLLAIFAGIVGFCAAGNDLVNFDLVLSSIPPDQQATYIGVYQMLQNTALFVLPLVGTFLADQAGLTVALVAAGCLRLLGVGLYVALGVGRPAGAAAEGRGD